jgi:TonB family protein
MDIPRLTLMLCAVLCPLQHSAASPTDDLIDDLACQALEHIALQEAVPDFAKTVVWLDATPLGQITATRILFPSGSSAWDDAALRAVQHLSFIPPTSDGKVLAGVPLPIRYAMWKYKSCPPADATRHHANVSK